MDELIGIAVWPFLFHSRLQKDCHLTLLCILYIEREIEV
jgi:hypothetical protein